MDEKQITALREAFESSAIAEGYVDLPRKTAGAYDNAYLQSTWIGWLACYQHLAPQLKDAARWDMNIKLMLKKHSIHAVKEVIQVVDAALDRQKQKQQC